MQNRHITIFWIVSWKCGSNGGKREWWIERKGWPGCMEACCRIWFVWCLRRRLRWWRMSLWTRWWFVTISWISWVNGLLLLIWSKWFCLFFRNNHLKRLYKEKTFTIVAFAHAIFWDPRLKPSTLNNITNIPMNWVQEDTIKNCMRCNTPFTALRRKHHCRVSKFWFQLCY